MITFRATPKQALQALAAGALCGALTYLLYRLTGGLPQRPDTFLRILWIALLGPVLEEFVFRSLAFWPAQHYLGPTWAVLLCAALFGLAHWQIPGSFFAFAAGLLFGYLRTKTDSLLPPVLAHVGANVVLLILQMAV